MSLKLSINQSQKQIMSQRMIQSVNILQMTALELRDFVQETALENPAMDIIEKPRESLDAKSIDYCFKEQNHYLCQRQNNDDDYDPKDDWNYKTDEGETLKDYLWSQINTEDFTKKETDIIKFLLESIDDRGYLAEDLVSVASIFRVESTVVEDLVKKLQELEPAGVCASDLKECLRIQLHRKQISSPVLDAMIEDCMDLIAKNRIPAIARKYRLTNHEAEGYCSIIKSLNPKPGSAFYNREEMKYIIPDISVVKFKDHFDILINESMYPDVEVNTYYRDMYKTADNDEVKEYLENKLRQVNWIMECLSRRKKTIMDIAAFILKEQVEFFEKGPDAIKPLRMADAAAALSVHESTVSRALNKKYIQCIWGVYPMGFFFKRSATIRGDLTQDDIKRLLKEIVDKEPSEAPYSDRIISEMLAERGVSVSRRTVAKYCEEEGIKDARSRKKY